jgi:hypothetical protein
MRLAEDLCWFVSMLWISSTATTMWRYSSCRYCGCSPFPSRHRFLKMANTRRRVKRSCRPVGKDDRSEGHLRAADGDPFRQSFTTLPTTKMASCRSVGGATIEPVEADKPFV